LFFKRNFARGELSQFQSLAQARNEGGVSEADVEFCREHLQALHDDFTRRFQDILSMVISDWVISPLTNVDDEEISLQEELLELQSNVELKPRLSQGYQQFWLQKEVSVLYPGVWGACRYGPAHEEAQSAARGQTRRSASAGYLDQVQHRQASSVASGQPKQLSLTSRKIWTNKSV
ncbi:hypothetical protein M514_14186, partial [Trichuris suis]